MDAFSALFRLLSPARRRQFGVTLLLMLAGAAAEMVTIGAALPFLALVADPDSGLVPPRVTALLGAIGGGSPVVGAAVLLIVAALASSLVRLALAWGSQRFVMTAGHDMAAAVFGRMLRQPYAEQVRRNSSTTLAAIEKVQGVVFGLLQPAMQGLIAAFIALCVFALLLSIDVRAAGIAAVSVTFAYVAVSLLVRPRLKRNSEALAGTQVERTRTVQEGLGGIRDIILDRSEALFEAKFGELDTRYRRAVATNQFVAGAPRFVVEAAGLVAIALVTLAMSLEPGGVVKAIPVLGALALGAQRLLPLLQQAYYGWSLASGNFQAFRDVIELMEAPVPEPQPEAEPLAFERELVFDRVGFRYPEGRFELSGVDLRIRAGEHVGIAGATGGGKSTLLDLMMGLLEPDEGSILVDGRPLDSASRPAWQAGLAHVPQSIYLADDTIAANIAFPRGAAGMDLERLAEAVRAAQLESFLAGLPEGLETYVGERGVRLSGGQRQRIGIARALYRRPRLLILDEATSALDEATEAAVLAALQQLRGGLTLVTVAHRATTLASCDRLIRVEGGRVSEG